MHRRLFFIPVILLSSLLVAACSNCNYLNRIYDTQCRPAPRVPPVFTAAASCTTQADPLPAPPAGATYIAVALSCPLGNSTAWSAGTASQTGNPVLCNHYSNTSPTKGAPFDAILLPNNASGSFTAGNGQTFTNCSDVWNGINDLSASDITGIYLSPIFCQTAACNDSSGCKATASSTNYLFVRFVPSQSLMTDNTPVTVPAGNYLGCAFLDSYNYASTGTVPWVPPGVSLLNSGFTTSAAGPTFADSVQNLPVPSSGSLIAAGSGSLGPLYKNAFTPFTVDPTTAATLSSSVPNGTKAVVLSFGTWKDYQ